MIRYLFIFFFCQISLVFGQIIEIDSIKHLPKYLSGKPLIIFDIDNTILRPIQDFGSDEWFCHRMKTYIDKGESENSAFEKTYSEYFLAQTLTQSKLVEPITADLISELKKEGFAIMALTTRGINLVYPTSRQLQSLSVEFSQSSPVQKDLFFNKKHPVLFTNGILFTNGTHKGEAFNTFCELADYHPSLVVFINDKSSDLIQVEEGCKQKNIPFTGLRYGYLDERVRTFSDRLSEIQRTHLPSILSDEEAKKLLK